MSPSPFPSRLTKLVLALNLASMSSLVLADEAATLPTVTVKASPATAQSPTSGYSAGSSAAASKTDTPWVLIDHSVSVITRQQIEDQAPHTLSEALSYTPGVFSNAIGSSSRYDYIVLRGFNGHMNNNQWLDGLRLAGDPEGSNSPQVDPFFVERMDVVRGPDSVLYGQSSPGGLVALTSKRPLSSPLHQLEVGIGNNQQQWLGLDITGPLNDRPDLDYRLVVKGQRRNEQQTLAQSERYTVAPSLSWRIDGQNRLLLQAYLQHEPSTGYHGSVPWEGSGVNHQGSRLPASFDDGASGDGMHRQQQMFGYQFEHDFNSDWQFRQNLRYQKSKVSQLQVYQTGWAGAGSSVLNRAASQGEEHGETFLIDNQLQGKLTTGAVQHTLLVGVDSSRMRNGGYNRYGSADSLDTSAPQYDSGNITFGAPSYFNHDNLQTGIYAQDQMAWNRWRLTLGVRQDQARVHTDDPQSGSRSEWNGSKVTTRAGVLYEAANGLTPYFNYSEGFDPNASYATGSDGQLLAPQQSRQKEVGLKYQPAGGQTQLSIASYDLRQQNLAYYNPITLTYQPVGVVTSRGIELEGKTRIGNQWSLMASMTFNRLRIDQGPQQGNTPFGSPSRMASLWVDYAFASGLGLGSGIRYTGPSWADSANTTRLPSYTLVDLALRYDLGRMSPAWQGATLRLSANNLFNRTYVASCYDSLTYCYYGSKRTLSATLGYQW
ncbi:MULTISPECIES: TonB-dependent siderophore receptor [unclassified Paludibacterium]|uniref:TonB-dependent siderophore receptor n=1 Tax=unclassified Paludibacterium TaxID=2618429 RepID=UPI001C0498DB|nr:TonB-dependent siderophore receptor [Paludibacterium sp. B53371]BEV71820.1 ferrioxamine receptor FoxA [Paludibacterium sp. THUN1379]